MRASSSARQLPLDLPHTVSFRRDDFLESESNAAALALIERWPDWNTHAAGISGPHGAGKSHLASIWAERAGARFMPANLLQKEDVPGALTTGALVVENVRPKYYDEPALFHLLNFARETGGSLLFTTEGNFEHGLAGLPDLASRLRAMPVARLSAPDDALIAAVLMKLFADRQVSVDEDLIRFLLPRMERSLAAARALVAELDHAALAAGRPVTRAFVAKYFHGESGLSV